MGDDEAAMVGKYGAVLGKGAAKYGKKAAQSEAGRRATTAAVKGACDGVRDDMISRYGTDPDPSTTSTLPMSPATPTARKISSGSAKRDKEEDDRKEENEEYREYIASTRRLPASERPPKPSFFNRINFSVKSSAKKPKPKHRRVDPKDRIYKSRLAREPDWDRLPLARAQYNFRGEMKCDLVFRKGQVIQVITKTETQNDWWEGKLEGKVGIFPANYVRLI